MIPEESETMAAGKLAVLSNVNMNMVIRMLQKQAQVYETEGYGNELGVLLNPASSYHTFQPDITFFIMDLAELLEHNFSSAAAEEKIADCLELVSDSPNPVIRYVKFQLLQRQYRVGMQNLDRTIQAEHKRNLAMTYHDPLWELH